jgi:rare lipoprotein A
MTSKTASGERANPNAMVAAHRSLAFGTCVSVKNLRNGRSVVVRINDRGPFVKGRIIDLSRVAASRLGFVQSGWTNVRLTTLGRGGC